MSNSECSLCGKPGKWEIKVDDDLQLSDHANWKQVCEEHAQFILFKKNPYIRRQPVKSLNEAYVDRTPFYSFARCPNCKSIFQDDVMLYGSLLCPNRECEGFALERGIRTLDDE